MGVGYPGSRAAGRIRCNVSTDIPGADDLAVTVVIGRLHEGTVRVERLADGVVFLVLFPNKDKVSKQTVDCQRN